MFRGNELGPSPFSDGPSNCDRPSRPACQPQRLCAKAGGARRDRTDDLLLAKQALSQLSYGPVRYQQSEKSVVRNTAVLISDYCPLAMVGPGRLELPTSRLSGVRSNHLSYGPPVRVAKPQASGSRDRCRCQTGWSDTWHLNPAPDGPRKERETKTAASRQMSNDRC